MIKHALLLFLLPLAASHSPIALKFPHASYPGSSLSRLVRVTKFDRESWTFSGRIDFDHQELDGAGKRIPFGTTQFWTTTMLCAGLILFAGLMSGLNMGYLSIDTLVLELKLKNGTEREKRDVRRK